MDKFHFELNRFEEELRMTSTKYDFCLSKVLDKYLNSDDDFDFLHKPCDGIKNELSQLMDKYQKFDQINKTILD